MKVNLQLFFASFCLGSLISEKELVKKNVEALKSSSHDLACCIFQFISLGIFHAHAAKAAKAGIP